MNNPVPKYFEHPDRSIRFLEHKALQVLHFKFVSTSIDDAYPAVSQAWGYWIENFQDEIKRKPNSPKKKLYLQIVNGELSSLEDVYLELKKLSKPTERGNSLKDVKKKVAQKAFASEKYGDAFVSNDTLISAVKSAATAMAFKGVQLEDVVVKTTELVGVHSADEKLSDEQINTLVELCQRRITKLEALDTLEAAIIDQDEDAKALLFLWVKIRRHYTVDESIVMALSAWASFGKLGKGKVQTLLKKLTKLGALKLVQKGKVGSKAGIASKYKRLV